MTSYVSYECVYLQKSLLAVYLCILYADLAWQGCLQDALEAIFNGHFDLPLKSPCKASVTGL